jgi:hypothetical protein
VRFVADAAAVPATESGKAVVESHWSLALPGSDDRVGPAGRETRVEVAREMPRGCPGMRPDCDAAPSFALTTDAR